MLARALAVVALALPVLGLGYVLVRLVRRRRGGLAAHRGPARPAGLALLVAVALVVGLGWAWWPAGDRYRPVRAWEGGTVLDAVRRRQQQPARRRVAGARPHDLARGRRAAADRRPARAGHGAGAAGGADGARAASGAAAQAPTWVFPFDRPLPPGEGDNQALAVNTRDGSVAYDVSFALVWADEDTVLNRNEAYALASCRDCRTVAVAFQVVLLVGSVDVVVPQNLAAAVNYACVECVTYALATQLVVTLPGPLSDDGPATWPRSGRSCRVRRADRGGAARRAPGPAHRVRGADPRGRPRRRRGQAARDGTRRRPRPTDLGGPADQAPGTGSTTGSTGAATRRPPTRTATGAAPIHPHLGDHRPASTSSAPAADDARRIARRPSG